MKKLLINLVRWGVPLAIIAWLVVNAVNNNSFGRLRDEPKQWDLLALATVLCFAAVTVTIVRWYFLVRALDIPFQMRDALRLGFLGYLWNFVTPGSAGGDVFKAVFLGRERPGLRAEVAITVIVDRLIGLYALFIVGGAAILLTGVLQREHSPQIGLVCQVTFWCLGVGTAIFVFTSLPGFTKGPISRWLQSLPRVGPIVERMNRANRMYYHRYWVLLLAVAMSVLVHTLFSIAIWLMARGLLSEAPSLADHFVIVPLAMATGAIPLAPNGLGTFELLIDFLYQHLHTATAVAASAGLLVALCYRIITVLIAAVGAAIYLASRREMSQVLHQAEAATEPQESTRIPPQAAMSL